MKFSFAVIPTALLCAQAVVGAPGAIADSILQSRQDAARPSKPSLTNWLQDHLRLMFNVSMTHAEFNKSVDATYSANAPLTFNGGPVPVDFLKANVNGQLGNATDIKLRFENVIELQNTPGDSSAGIVAGVIFLDRYHDPNPKTVSEDVFIITIGPDAAFQQEKDNRRIIASTSVVVTH
ncbi:hypothetical protein HGRIS_001674 [Hohenbuehelia grisea]|uniref:Uncharacterized protein n=1 Tax=Hohenbuehelia grisea TaxID=104357 RepID=A0ABR3JI41_9AGAR